MVERTPILENDGTPTGATFAIEVIDGATTVRFDSRGTTEGTRAYRRGMVLMLSRLGGRKLAIVDLCIETATTRDLNREDRRVYWSGPNQSRLVDMAVRTRGNVPQADVLRAKIHTAAARTGRKPGAKGGGNGTKRLRFYLWGALCKHPARLRALIAHPRGATMGTAGYTS